MTANHISHSFASRRPTSLKAATLLFAMFFWLSGALCGQTYLPKQIPEDSTLYKTTPYSYTGMVTVPVSGGSSRIFGSGVAAAHPKLVFSCANLFFDTKASDPWMVGVRWHRAWRSSRAPLTTDGKALRGYLRLAGYAAAARFSLSDPKTFAMDFTVHYGYEDVAEGTCAKVATSAVTLLKSERSKRIMGYPVGLYTSADLVFLMHETGSFTRAFYDRTGAYLSIDEVSTGGGNSGGPVWVDDGVTNVLCGVVVSGLERSTGGGTDRAGVFALDSSVTELINTAILATDTPAAPTITAQPTSRRVTAGTTVDFSVTASGSYLAYQWLAKGNPIAGATNSTYTLANVSTTDAGSYQVVVSNPLGEVRSLVATLAVDCAPVITRQPNALTITEGGVAVLSLVVTASPTPTYQWLKNGAPISGATASTYYLTAATAADSGSYTCTVTNSLGTVVSTAASLTVNPKNPVIVTQPANGVSSEGGSHTFKVTATGVSLTYRWLFNGVEIAGANSATLTIAKVTTAKLGTYQVVVSNTYGEARSTPVTLSYGMAPTVVTPPVAQTVKWGQAAAFLVVADGAPAPSYQWYRNGTAISGATQNVFTLVGTSLDDAGDYTCVVSNGVGSVTTQPARLVVLHSRLVNLSVRSTAGGGTEALIVGFIVDGAREKTLLLRGVGPTLSAYGVGGVLDDPVLELYNSGGVQIARNDDWGDSPDAAALVSVAHGLGAFTLTPLSADGGILAKLGRGSYTAQVSGKAGASGVAMLEAYDTTAGEETRLVNLAARTKVGTGVEVLIVGFVIDGNTAKELLIRGIGPTLAGFGVGGVLTDPQLEVARQSDGHVLYTNDDWGGTEELRAAFAVTRAFALTEGSKDAALLVKLEPGAYTAKISGAGQGKGVAMVEIYETP